MSNSTIASEETYKLISSEKVAGTDVYNQEGEKLGHVDSVMFDKLSGKAAYAVMSFGGFLGIGESQHPLPWDTLTYDTEKDGYIVNLSKEVLDAAPRYDTANEPDWRDQQYHRAVHDYYGVPVFWV